MNDQTARATVQASRLEIRWMVRGDLPEVVRIDDACYSLPWGEEGFLEWLRQQTCIGMVAHREGQVAGYFVYELHKRHLELHRFGVHPDFRRQGIGRRMVEKLAGKLYLHARCALHFDVQEDALQLQLFLRAMGFFALAPNRGDEFIRFVFDLRDLT